MKLIADKAARFQASDRFANVTLGEFCFVRQTAPLFIDRGTPEERRVDHYSWKGEPPVTFWGDTLEVSFSTTVADLSPSVTNRIVSILTYDHNLRDQIEAALENYYKTDVLERYDTDEFDRRLPTSPKKRKLRSMFGKPDLHLNADDDTDYPTQLRLYFNTSWDIEHPVEVVIQDWVICRIH